MSYGFIIRDDISSSSSSPSPNAFTFYVHSYGVLYAAVSFSVVLLSFVMTNACTNQISTSMCNVLHDMMMSGGG